MGVHRSDTAGRERPFINPCAGIFAGHRPSNSRGRMLRALEEFHIQDVEKTLPHVVNTMREGSFTQSAQGNVTGFLFHGSALGFVKELLGCAGVAEPDGYIVDRMDVIQTAFAGLHGNAQHEQVVIFQKQMVVRLLLDGNRWGCGGFLRCKESEENNCGRDVKPGFHGLRLSRGMQGGLILLVDDICAKRFLRG